MKAYLLTAACGIIAVAIVVYVCRAENRSATGRDHVAVGSAGPEWLADADQAMAAARSTDRDVLMEFGGSGSVGDSGAFDAAVFDTREFRERAGRQFVLVRLVSSADASPDRATRVATWGQRLGISQFPTLALLDAQGRPYASAAWQSRDAGESLKLLDSLSHVKVERDECFTLAQCSAGIERARHLDAALQHVGAFAGEAYLDAMRQILALDPDNSTGLRAKYQSLVSEVDINQAIQADVYPLVDKGDLNAALQRIDRLIVETSPTPEQRQLLLAFEGQLYFSLHDAPNAARCFDDAVRISPNSGVAARVLAAKAQIFAPPS